MLERLGAEITPEWTLACKTSSYLSTHLISLLSQFLTFSWKAKLKKIFNKRPLQKVLGCTAHFCEIKNKKIRYSHKTWTKNAKANNSRYYSCSTRQSRAIKDTCTCPYLSVHTCGVLVMTACWMTCRTDHTEIRRPPHHADVCDSRPHCHHPKRRGYK